MIVRTSPALPHSLILSQLSTDLKHCKKIQGERFQTKKNVLLFLKRLLLLLQVEYAMEAVKQGSACVGARSKTHAVMAALKRSTNDMSSYQKKIFKVDDHMGISISGLTADARSLCKYMRTECLQHKYVYESAVPVQRLVVNVADKCQGCTQSASGRPFGVGLLVAGVDQTGPHIYYNCPSGNYYEYKAMTIGARSQVSVHVFVSECVCKRVCVCACICLHAKS